MPTNCEFVFERAKPIYYSGELISGNVSVSSTKKLPLEGIRLEFAGLASTSWTSVEKLQQGELEHNDGVVALNKLQHSGTQDFVRECTALASDSFVLEPGTHFYHFGFRVPASAPPSSELRYGRVTYTLAVVLQRAATFNIVFNHTVVIKNRLDLNEHRQLNEKCLCSVHSGDRTHANNVMELTVPFCGFVPGQLIRYHLKLANIFHQPRVLVSLYQSTVYKCHTPEPASKEVVDLLATSKRQTLTNILRHIKEGHLSVPLNAQISTLDAACLIRTSYFVEAVVVGDKNRVLEKLVLPIVIGTVAFSASVLSVDENYNNFCYDNLAANVTDGSGKTSYGQGSQRNLPHNIRNGRKQTRISDQISLAPLQGEAYYNTVAEHSF